MPVKVLYIINAVADYLSDSFLLGLMKLKGIDIYLYPGDKEILYAENKGKYKVYGSGFTLYFGLNDRATHSAFEAESMILNGERFDLIIFSSIHHQFGIYLQYESYFKKQQLVFFDGEDHPSLFPYSGKYWRKPWSTMFPRLHRRYPYYKREITPDTIRYLSFLLMPRNVATKINLHKNVRPISFSIPEEKIVAQLPEKSKDFPEHIVDSEISQRLNRKQNGYVFTNEADYYKDLQASKFGITTKRAGWDCMRHYEIAANGTVICFKDLDKKPTQCAPHGLVIGKNCISYTNYNDLLNQIEKLSDSGYKELQQGSWQWAKDYSCAAVAGRIMNELTSAI
jgi:hypothetical protein